MERCRHAGAVDTSGPSPPVAPPPWRGIFIVVASASALFIGTVLPGGSFINTRHHTNYDRNCVASSAGLKTPRSVMIPVMNSAGVTSKAGL
jgi:hypothetical protein